MIGLAILPCDSSWYKVLSVSIYWNAFRMLWRYIQMSNLQGNKAYHMYVYSPLERKMVACVCYGSSLDVGGRQNQGWIQQSMTESWLALGVLLWNAITKCFKLNQQVGLAENLSKPQNINYGWMHEQVNGQITDRLTSSVGTIMYSNAIPSLLTSLISLISLIFNL